MAHPKGVLIERLQKSGDKPEFRTERTGPDHQPTFLSDVVVGGRVLGTGQGGNKRDAERRAAEEALHALEREAPDVDGAAVEDAEPDELEHEGSERDDDADYAEPVAAPLDADDELPFEGPWPVFESVLAAALHVAEERVADNLRGLEAREAVRDFTLQLYKELLQDLGDVVDA